MRVPRTSGWIGLLVVGFLGFQPAAEAKVVYVAKTGSDASDGLSWATAKVTVQSGLNAAVAGDEVWVTGGTYVQCVTLAAGVEMYGGFIGGEADRSQRDWKLNATVLDGNAAGQVVTMPSGATATTRIDGFTIRNGKASPDGRGGGLYCYFSSPTIINTTITGNSASRGGGFFCYGGSPTIANTTITGNSASLSGGGIYCDYSSLTIINTTITENSGGGIYCDYSSPTIINTIVAFNSSGVYRAGLGVPVLRNNCVYGNTAYNYSNLTDPTGTVGNISVDPKLAGVLFGNEHIQPDSPCRDAGDDALVQAGWRDMDGQSRIQGAHVDIGADESDGTNWPAGPYAVVRVSPNGNDANDGSSWVLAKQTVQSGIDSVSASGGEVWVRTGVYNERITLRAYAYIYGGFAGTEDSRDHRDWRAQPTVLDGQASGSVVTVLTGEKISTIDGFTIRNGKATYGGGLYCYGGSPTIANTTITGNIAASSGSGGGIYCNYSSLTIINTAITENSASYGGGLYCLRGSPTIANTTITGNIASSSGGGGGIYCASSSPTIINTTITENIASYGGGLYGSGGFPTIINTTITGNSASSGGGVYCSDSFPTIINTIITFNSSGIFFSSGSSSASAILRHNCVYGNTAYNYSGVTDPTGTLGNISADPKLAGVLFGNVHIQPDSPCRDAGDDALVQAGWRDMDGQSRIQGAHVDIGADESDGTIWPTSPYAVVRVSPNGNDVNDGSSWGLAKQTVQAGIDSVSVLGGEVWVRTGVYNERIKLRAYAHIYGGFAGTEDSRDHRDWRAQPTVLDGQAGGSVVTVLIDARVSTIDGFTIRNGKAADGGGICCYAGSPTIANTTITGTSAGGGLYCYGGSPTIANSTIAVNNGGGIYCYYSSPTIINTTITGNSASAGGGLYCYGGSPIIANSTIAVNSGGGIYCYSSSPTIANTTITGNSASSGGGVYCSDSLPTIINTIITFNSSGVYLTGWGVPVLRDNCVYGNTAYNYSGVTDPTGTLGNISADPKLADVLFGNVHIQPDSPCRDAGDDALVQAGWRDMDGQSRIQGAHVDIGADESDGTIWPASPYAVVRVSPNGNDGNDGSSWVLAKQTVQAGIDSVSASGGEVWVRTGVYNERITLRGYAYIYGGFAGTEDSRDHRDWRAQPTVLDGQASGSVVTVLTGEKVSTIDGFTIRNGKAADGGGLYCYYSSPTIINTTITGNSASRGGGVYCLRGSPTIANTTITGNIASCGGGLYGYGGFPTIINTTITGNSGDGIYCDSSSPTIINTIIAFNSSGVCKTGAGVPVLRNNCVYGNTGYNYSNLTDPTGTVGNISADPKLADGLFGNVHIQPDSPCRDAGDDALVQAGWRDMDGQSRIQGAHVDIGADESDGTNWPAGPYAVVRVSPNGNDANDGSSWVLAKQTVQSGIDSVSASGGEVWVRTGVYNERITLRAYAYIYGGFAGTEDSRDHRDWRTQPTVLDGQASGSVVTVLTGEKISTIDGFTIRNGKATYGGGLYCYGGSPTIANTTITGNSGGGIYCESSSPTIINTAITGNSASRGGGIYCYGGSPTIINTTITGNNAYYGGGICCIGGSPTISNNTITGNRASSGGGVYFASNSLTIANTIIAFNSSGIGVANNSSGTLTLRYNCVYANAQYNYSGVPDPTGTNGNISADPRFVRTPAVGADGKWGTADDDLGDLHLRPGSPCIDAGDNGALPLDMLTDLDGRFRFFDDPATPDTGAGTRPIVDMGAFEYIPGDFDRDGDIDADDMKMFAACLSGPAVAYTGDCAGADFDRDGDVDQSDFGFLQRCYSGKNTPVDPGCNG